MKMFIWKYENNELDSSYTQDKFNRFINDKKKALQIWEKVKDELSKQKKDKKFLSKKVNDKLFFFFTSKLSEEDILNIINSDIKVIKINNDMKTPYRYGGSSDNRQVKIGQEFYMAKYSKTLDNIVNKNDLTIHRQTAFMEYLACKILKLYKINVQEVEMGFDLDKNEYCVLCKDFTNHFQIIPLSSESSHNVREEANDINDLTGYLEIKLFDKYKNLNKKEAIDNWLIMSVTDFLIGNRDRHLGNIGYLYDYEKLNITPIFDNGASLGCYIHIDKIEDFYNLKELKKCIIDEYQDLYQNFNKIHINYDNILNHKLPKVFYNKVEDILGNYNTPLGLDIFDKLAKLPNLSGQEILHIKLAKMIYIRNFKILKESIKEKK